MVNGGGGGGGGNDHQSAIVDNQSRHTTGRVTPGAQYYHTLPNRPVIANRMNRNPIEVMTRKTLLSTQDPETSI